MLVMSGIQPPLRVMNFLYANHAGAYVWAVRYSTNPRPLGHVTRDVIRGSLRGNVVGGVAGLGFYPRAIRMYILYDDA